MTDLPTISVVTTNYNGAAYLERAMCSVLDQNYPRLEYIVIDGGSQDGSQEIIARYAPRLAYWASEPDNGFAHAYNKGFARATGDVLAYLNSDDAYCPWAFDIVGRCFRDLSEARWLTTLFPLVHAEAAEFVGLLPAQPFNRRLFYAGYYGRRRGFIQQESTFWRRDLWLQAGGALDESLALAIDADLWARFFEIADLYAVATPLGGFRLRSDSKSAAHMPEYLQEFSLALARSAERAGVTLDWRTRAVNRWTKQFLNAVPTQALPHSWRYTGKTVQWDLAKGQFAAQDTRIYL